MQRRKRVVLFTFAILVSLLVACSANSNDKKEGKEDKTEKKETTVLNFAYHLQPPSLDPHTNTDIGTRDMGLHIFEALVTMDASLEVAPMLAESFEVNEDGKEVVFHLREGIKFHHGEEMKAEDVVASLERWQSLSSQAQTYHSETTFEIVDDYTVIAHIPNPSTIDMYIFADMTQFAAIMPKDIVEEAGAEIVSDYIGTGPYKFAEFRQDQYVHLVKNEDYQSRDEEPNALAGGKNASLDEIYFHFVTDASTRVAGLQSGEYDIANAIPQDVAEQLSTNEDIKLDIAANSFPTLIFNKKSRLFTDVKFREIVNAAINVEDMLLAAYSSDEYFVKDHGLVKPEQTGWYSEKGQDVYNTYDPELAKEMLAEAGYDGEEVIILTSRENMDEYNMSVVTEEALKNIGMNVKLAESDWGTILEKREDPESWDIFFTSFAIRPMPTQYLFLNDEWFGWTDSEELKDLNEKILQAGTIEAAQAYKDEFHEVFWEYLPVIKPGNKSVITAIRENVDGFEYLAGPIIWNVVKK